MAVLEMASIEMAIRTWMGMDTEQTKGCLLQMEGITMTEQTDFQRLRKHNLETMRRELYKLKVEYQERFDFWLLKRGEYTTEVECRWFKFYEKAIEYKELNFKMKEIERQVGKE